ncbi:hypothetical protein NEDG_02276, partial [Nematocida displodere]
MKQYSVGYFRKVCKTLQACSILYLAYLTAFTHPIHCVEEGPLPEYIVSPYTEQTLQFFSRNRHVYYANMLETVDVGDQTHIVKKQRCLIEIFLPEHSLDSVPECFVPGLEFTKLVISLATYTQRNRFDHATLSKILSAFGPIYADFLGLCTLDVVDSEEALSPAHDLALAAQRVSQEHQSTGALENTPPALTHTINTKMLKITGVSLPTIGWLKKHLDMSQSRIDLVIDGQMRLANLEILDGLQVSSIEKMHLSQFRRLDSLECKLFREGRMPKTLIIDNFYSDTRTEISELTRTNLANNHWELLCLPGQIWRELMRPTGTVKHLVADHLAIDVGECVD